MSLHSNDRPYHCKTCNKHFKTSAGLGKHNRVLHNGVKPFVCSHCNKSFRLVTQLDDHMRIHLTQEEISCSRDLKRDVETHRLQMVQDPAKHTVVYVQSQCNQNDVKLPSTVSNPDINVPSPQIFQCSDKQNFPGGDFENKTVTQLNFHMRIHEMQEEISCNRDLKQDVECHRLQMVHDPAKHTVLYVQSPCNQNSVPSNVSNPNINGPSPQIFQCSDKQQIPGSNLENKTFIVLRTNVSERTFCNSSLTTDRQLSTPGNSNSSSLSTDISPVIRILEIPNGISM